MTSGRKDRVRAHTVQAANAQIDDAMRDRLFRYAAASEREIAQRLEALDREWDVERYLEVMAPAVSLPGIALGLINGRRWLLVPGVMLAFLVQHAVTGRCPPSALLRHFGVRTRSEIDEERYALKALRGDFAGLPPDAPRNRVTRVDAALEAVRL